MRCPRCGAHLDVPDIAHVKDTPFGLRAVVAEEVPGRVVACAAPCWFEMRVDPVVPRWKKWRRVA